MTLIPGITGISPRNRGQETSHPARAISSFLFESDPWSRSCVPKPTKPKDSLTPRSSDTARTTVKVLQTPHTCRDSLTKETQHNQAHRNERLHSKTAMSVNTRCNQMARGKLKNICNKTQCHLSTSKPSSPTTASPECPNTPEKQDSDLKSHLMKMIEEFKEDLR
jgi:hypothetical protein